MDVDEVVDNSKQSRTFCAPNLLRSQYRPTCAEIEQLVN